MGGKSSSATSQTTNNTALNTNIDGDDVIGVIGSDNVEITSTDFGSIEKSFDFGEKALSGALKFGEKSLDEAFDFGGKALDSNRDVINSTESILKNNASTTKSIINDQVAAIKGLAESLKVGEQESSKKIALALVAGLVVMALVFLFVMLRK